jgi:aminoglycoside phosphotransferase (APT) family kinase protein
MPVSVRTAAALTPAGLGAAAAASRLRHNDLNLSNILTDGARITEVVDWDEFGLGSRAPPGANQAIRR